MGNYRELCTPDERQFTSCPDLILSFLKCCLDNDEQILFRYVGEEVSNCIFSFGIDSDLVIVVVQRPFFPVSSQSCLGFVVLFSDYGAGSGKGNTILVADFRDDIAREVEANPVDLFRKLMRLLMWGCLWKCQ